MLLWSAGRILLNISIVISSFFFFLWRELIVSFHRRQWKFSRHYFVFIFFSCNWVCSDKTAENFSSRFCFSSFFFLWRDWVYSDKTAEYFSSLSFSFFWCYLVYSDKTAEYFSSLFCFIPFFFLGVTGSVRI